MRTHQELITSAHAVIDGAFKVGATRVVPLFSGGHDSISACFVASLHSSFNGIVYHIDTGIGSKATRAFVESVCHELEWKLRVFKSKYTYEMFVRNYGFPGPGNHQWVYNRLKDRAINQIMKGFGPSALITGCRQQESVRRMGHVESVKIGETSKKSGKVWQRKRIWTAPCYDWSKEEQVMFMQEYDLPLNPVKQSIIGMSGECFCGAFARPNEIEMLRRVVPDVALEIDRLTIIAKECGRRNCEWGTPKRKGKVVAASGPLCSSCDARAATTGIIVENV